MATKVPMSQEAYDRLVAKLANLQRVLEKLKFKGMIPLQQAVKALKREQEHQGKRLEVLEQRLQVRHQYPQVEMHRVGRVDSLKSDSLQVQPSQVKLVKSDSSVPAYSPVIKKVNKRPLDGTAPRQHKRQATSTGRSN
ncbi:hypothetical protein IW146_008324 [Coemansia sp. RSA 922]|nr:hypothetical protein H4S03_005963 [Coemansia sp. S3946]KAJ2043593.1 hypothetical protein H4S04_006679 [Coemansia sp. S16]KAJ2047067.1 hypothetical protein GGI08_006361 [Coemansia sp. S2]KAJ2068296.1 hypothetical protein GGH13_004969 [Coemansia sp. S155-1]KAJ2105219.1 hypothetical protein IW146_008324 [Coemansia sp. RSA 922]KAJ2344426.1 hypothetical protein GGH92_004486 [Coemansia sp. RSA 2673]